MSVGPKMKIFAVIRTRGPVRQPSLSLEVQQEWPAHARFMNDLEVRGAVILGGPLDGTPGVLLVMRADSADEAAQHLQGDPWTALNLLVVEKCLGRSGSVPCQVPASRHKPAKTVARAKAPRRSNDSVKWCPAGVLFGNSGVSVLRPP